MRHAEMTGKLLGRYNDACDSSETDTGCSFRFVDLGMGKLRRSQRRRGGPNTYYLLGRRWNMKQNDR